MHTMRNKIINNNESTFEQLKSRFIVKSEKLKDGLIGLKIYHRDNPDKLIKSQLIKDESDLQSLINYLKKY